MLDLRELGALSQDELIARARANPAWFRSVLQQTTTALNDDRKTCQLAYYKVRNPDALTVHTSTKREIAVVGGNRSSKTDTMLAEIAIQTTGHIPLSLMGVYPREKIRAPIRARIVCNSLTDTLEPVIKPKLRWDQWNGVGDPSGGRGHWGWIPRACLVGGSWEKAYSERYRTLHVSVDSYWRGPTGEINSVSGTSSIQMMCLAPITPVLRPDGTWTPLADIRVGDYVATRAGARLVEQVYRYEAASRVRIKLWSGPEIIATPTHRHFLADGTRKQTAELTTRDVLALVNGEPEKCDSLAETWRLGWTAILIGDGSLCSACAFTAVPGSRVLANMPPLPPGYRHVPASTPSAQHRLVNETGKAGPWAHPLQKSLRADGLWKMRAYEKFIPAWVFRQPREGIEIFLRHLWDTDGTGAFGVPSRQQASMYTTTSVRLAGDVQRLLWRLGYSAGITTFLPSGRCYGRNAITGTEIISRRRIYRVQTCWTVGRLRGRIRKIETLDPGPVVCLTVEGVHEFVANGLVTGNSYDQDLSAFPGASFHLIGHDELPPPEVYRENRLRTLDVRGQIITAFTPPDEAGAAQADAAWFFDEIYEPGLPGPHQHPEIDTVTLFTERNTILSAADVQAIAERLTEEQRAVRLYGRFIHLSGVVYPLFERLYATWCFRCQKRVLGMDGICPSCQGDDLGQFSHVIEPFPIPVGWPVVMVIDPHPRKADAIGWFAVSPSDDCFLVGELEAQGTAKDVVKEIRQWEEAHRIRPVKRLMDPNIATETNDRMQRGWTIRKEYDAEGLRCDLANDEINAGISQVNEFLRPDPRTRRPRLAVFNTCARFIYGMTRWTWDEWTRGGDREPKEKVRDRYKDFPDLVRYFVLDRPSYQGYTRGMIFQHRRRG